MMERSSAEERRRQRERIMMEEGKALWQAKKKEDLELELREQEQIRELSRNKLFGRPGHGAPTENIRKKKFTEYQFAETAKKLEANSEGLVPPLAAAAQTPEFFDTAASAAAVNPSGPRDALTFGRSGNGAPVRTKSGRVRTQMVGNPEIRFQENESVKKSIFNSIRYAKDRETKDQYHNILEDQIKQRKMNELQEKEREKSIARQLEQIEGTQWGKPGPGGTYWRNCAVTGQGFFDKMGWSASGDPRKRQPEVKASEVEDMKKEMDENRIKKDLEHQDMNSNVGVELVPLLKEFQTGKPRKDPNTGYLMNHSLPSTDVTKIADPKRAEALYSNRNFPEERKRYYETLNSQVSARESEFIRQRKVDEEEQKRHFENWETFWGRPGYGAPREGRGPQKENLMKLLHYPSPDAKVPNNVELITLERLPVK